MAIVYQSIQYNICVENVVMFVPFFFSVFAKKHKVMLEQDKDPCEVYHLRSYFTTPGIPCGTFYDKYLFLLRPTEVVDIEVLWDGTYGLVLTREEKFRGHDFFESNSQFAKPQKYLSIKFCNQVNVYTRIVIY